jgi:hypothetical protein
MVFIEAKLDKIGDLELAPGVVIVETKLDAGAWGEIRVMTENESRKKDKFFGAGVSVGIWCYSGDGNWTLVINREKTIKFYGLDELKRSIQALHKRFRAGSDLEMYYADSEPITFNSQQDAADCMAEVEAAITYIQSVSKEDGWHDVPANIFQLFRSA